MISAPSMLLVLLWKESEILEFWWFSRLSRFCILQRPFNNARLTFYYILYLISYILITFFFYMKERFGKNLKSSFPKKISYISQYLYVSCNMLVWTENYTYTSYKEIFKLLLDRVYFENWFRPSWRKINYGEIGQTFSKIDHRLCEVNKLSSRGKPIDQRLRRNVGKTFRWRKNIPAPRGVETRISRAKCDPLISLFLLRCNPISSPLPPFRSIHFIL